MGIDDLTFTLGNWSTIVQRSGHKYEANDNAH